MQQSVDLAINQVETVLKGKAHSIKLCLACFFAGGHLLLEDLPGMGKTTLAMALAKVLGLQYTRVQFTSDMLPADILGSSIFDSKDSSFRFHKGPIFSQLLLADEINRSTPKTQSALLEAMSERSVSVDGQSLHLPEPFFVIATQNPISQLGTFPLPESQLDRFLMCIELGYPDARSERALLQGLTGRALLESLKTVLNTEQMPALFACVNAVNVSDGVLDYIQDLVAYTRESSDLQYGISPRGALALVQAAKAWAFIEKREFVIPEDIQMVLSAVFLHRLTPAANSQAEAAAVLELMLREVSVR